MVQRIYATSTKESIIAALQRGDLVVMPTDTVFGILASALMPPAVAKLYRARKRNPKKPCIILLASGSDIAQFGVRVSKAQVHILRRVWPGPVTVVLTCSQKHFTYIHRGTNTLAFRVPKDAALRALLKITGPVLAPSANLEGSLVATSVRTAKQYFGAAVATYVSGRPRSNVPSGIVDLTWDMPKVLRDHPALADFRIDSKAHTIAKWTKTSKRARSNSTNRSKVKSPLKVRRGR